MMIVAYYLVLSHVPYVHDFDNITPLFSDHVADTDVLENNRVMMLKS
jgi:predicted ThiF/HesA family dinucleotide-utilizing enzyme